MRRSGKCPDCPYRWTLRKDGMISRHLLYTGDKRYPCAGSGQPPVEGTEKVTR